MKMSFEEAYNEYLILGTTHLKKQSVNTISHNFNSHILSYFKGKYMNELKKDDFLQWKASIFTLNYSNSYNTTLYLSFSSFLNYCVDNSYIEYNYLKMVGKFKKRTETKNYDFYTYDEFLLFLSGFDNIIYKSYFEFLFFTGVRPSEAMALKFNDIIGNRVIINKSIQRKGNRDIETTKNVSSNRIILIDNHLKRVLNDLYKCYKVNNGDSYVFGCGKPLSPTSIDRYKLNACNKVGIRPITQHQFRHSHATLLLSKGIMINEVSRRLGHSNTSTTLDIYSHTNLLQEKRVIKLLNFLRFNTISHNFKSIFKHY